MEEKEQTADVSLDDNSAKLMENKIPEPNVNIDRANAAAQRLEEAVAKQKVENDRKEAMIVQNKLGGKAEGGKEEKEEKEETPHEYRLRIQKEMAEGKTEFGN